MKKKFDILYLPLHRQLAFIGSEVYWAFSAFRTVSGIYNVKGYVGSLSDTAIKQLGGYPLK